jgi:D-alanyl-lipoteichoic acid acyltransferase DltB (MBOAT superfamily)
MAFLTYFPQLVAGPIERAGHLLPQFKRERQVTIAHIDEATWLLLWGLFKKVVIADNLATYSEMVFSSSTLPMRIYLLGTVAFGVQIYCDFSGYSDIARGLGKLFGFDIMFNFHIPYAATNLREFWARWHISLSGWFRDYVYIPLGGNRSTLAHTYRNLLVVMLIAGLWHGANWTFVLWGLWHGLALIAHLLWRKLGFTLPTIISWPLTLAVVLFGWLFFRANSLEQLWAIFFLNADSTLPLWTADYAKGLLLFSAPIIAVEMMHFLRGSLTWPASLRLFPKSTLYGFVFAAILLSPPPWKATWTFFVISPPFSRKEGLQIRAGKSSAHSPGGGYVDAAELTTPDSHRLRRSPET